MMNPYLGDTTLRAGRNVIRKLGWNDRIFGTMSLALEYDITPSNMALAAAAALSYLITGPEQKDLPGNLSESSATDILNWIWQKQRPSHAEHILALLRV